MIVTLHFAINFPHVAYVDFCLGSAAWRPIPTRLDYRCKCAMAENEAFEHLDYVADITK